MKPLKLLAEDAEDLKVISAALQDAVVKVGDIAYEPAARRLTIAGNRFRWEAAKGRGGERVRTALQLAGAIHVQARGIRRDSKDALAYLLAIDFEPSAGVEDPGGAVIFRFAGDADLRVEVECIDAILADVSEPWPTPRRPGHE
jgi:hypothetical protein